MGFDVYTLIFLALAVFIFVRLRAVLGQRTGNERPPVDPLRRDRREDARESARESGKVIPLPASRTPEPAGASSQPLTADRWKGIAEPGSPLATGLDALVTTDKTFNAVAFVEGAKRAYEMIVMAFNTGDTKQLKGLLTREVYDRWAQVIQDRESRGERVEASFVSIDTAELVSAQLRGRTAQIGVRFVSQIISATHDREGKVLEGSAEEIQPVTDLWTFSREVNASDPNWRLAATDEA